MKRLIKATPGFRFINKIRMNLTKLYMIIKIYHYDFKRFNQYHTDNALDKSDQKSFESWLLQDKHRIEKGLSLPEPKPNFGEAVIERLINNLHEYKNRFGKDHVFFIALGSLQAYEKFHLQNKIVIKDSIQSFLSKLDKDDYENKICSTVGTFPAPVLKDNSQFFSDFVSSRSSCRHFNTEKVVERSILEKVIKMSAKTPSVCNRQHWKVHVFTGEHRSKILSLQNGNLGFTNKIPNLAVITSDLRSFYMATERTQPFTDGGMFAMTFMYALHSYGISSCALNWCTSPSLNEKIYEYTSIAKNESIIMLIAFGYADENANNAKSPRLSIDNFYTFN